MKKSNALFPNRIFPAVLIAGLFLINDPASAQSGNKYATGLNSLTATDGLGSYNYEGLNFYTNAVKRGAFTKDGEFEALYKAHFYADLKCDSIIKSWKAQTDNLRVFGNAVIDSTLQAQRLEADALSIAGNANITDTLNIGLLTLTGNRISSSNGTISFSGNNLVKAGTLIATTVDAQTYLLSGTAIDFNALDSTDKALQVQIDSIETTVANITSSQWQNTGTNSISYTGNATVNGTFQANNINTALLTISDKFTAPKGEFDTLRAERQLSINHNLKLGRDSGSTTESDIASKIDVLKIQSDPNVSFDVVMAEGNEAKIGIGVKEGLTAKLNVLGGTRLNGDLQVTGNSTFNGDIISQGAIDANTINASNINLNGTPFSGQFLRLSGDTMKGNITFDNNTSLNHSSSNGLLRFNNPQGENIIGLGYNLDDPSTQQGFLIAPSGYKGNPNGSFAFGDANPNGQIILALGTGQSGTRINLDGAGKRLILQNDGGDKFSMGGVNAPTLLETTQGINISPRSGFAFTGTHLLDIQGSVNAQQYYINGNPIDVAGIDSTLDTLQSIVNNFQSSQWQNTGDGMITYDGSAVINGSLQSASITTGNLTIVDKIFTKSAEVERLITSDSLHVLKSFEINGSLKLLRDSSEMYAEMSTKDTAVALMLQKEPTAPVVIGDAPAPVLGEARPKLTVFGNTKLDGQLNVTGNITSAGNINANCVTASCLNVNGQTSMDTLRVTKIKASRIVPLDGDSLIKFGNSTLFMNTNSHIISTDNDKGFSIGWLNNWDVSNYQYALAIGHMSWVEANSAISIGNFSRAKGANSIVIGSEFSNANAPHSMAVGYQVETDPAAQKSIVIGSGSSNIFINDKPNSLMVGFNTRGNTPTLFVGPASGTQNSIGEVGIGTFSPSKTLDVAGTFRSRSDATFDTKIILETNSKIEHSTSTAKLSFDNLGTPNIISLGYGNALSNFQGLGILPLGTSGNPNGSIILGDLTNSPGDIVLTVGDVMQGTNEVLVHLDADNERINMRNGAGDELAIEGVNGPSQWNAPLGISLLGNVGIGNTSFDQKLNVDGDVNVSGGNGYRINNAAPAGQYLRGDGTRFTPSAIDVNDIPSNSNSYIQNQTGTAQTGGFNVSGNGILGGNVGIGTSNPQTTLHVFKNDGAFNLEGTDHVYMQFYPQGFSAGRMAWLGFGSAVTQNAFSIRNEMSDGIIQLLSPVTYVNGNLGVGTADPQTTLHVFKNDGALSLEGSDHVFMQFYPQGFTSGRKGWMGYGSTGSTTLTFSNEFDGGKIHLNTKSGSTISHVVIDEIGNVGIGTLTPGEKLDVAGSIRSNSLSGSGDRVILADASGKIMSLTPGTTDQVLLGTGVWGDVPTNTTWSLSGNSSTDAATNFIGTTNAVDFVVKTNNMERMRITSGGDHPGKVGIGTNNPQKQLHVKTIHDQTEPPVCVSCPAESHWGLRLEDVALTGAQGNPNQFSTVWDIEPKAGQLFFKIPQRSDADALVVFVDDASVNDKRVIINGNTGIGTADPKTALQVKRNSAALNLEGTDHVYMQFYPQGFSAGRMAWLGFGSAVTQNAFSIRNEMSDGIIQLLSPVTYVNGNLGVGTADPQTTLHVFKNDGAMNLEGSDHVFMQFYPQGFTSGRKGWMGYGSTGSTTLTFSNEFDGGKIYLSTKSGSTISNVVIDQDGKVGIGTDAPGAELDVIGMIRTCEAKINLSSNACPPDFVFENTYNLFSLKKRRDIVLKNKHLLYINSGNEMKKNGLLLSEFSFGILQNVEEHELYLYDHDEKINLLISENKELKSMITAQNKKMEEMQKKIDALANKN